MMTRRTLLWNGAEGWDTQVLAPVSDSELEKMGSPALWETENQKSEWVEGIATKWNERQEGQCLKIWAAGEKGRQKVSIHAGPTWMKKDFEGNQAVTLTTEKGETEISIPYGGPLVSLLWPRQKNYLKIAIEFFVPSSVQSNICIKRWLNS